MKFIIKNNENNNHNGDVMSYFTNKKNMGIKYDVEKDISILEIPDFLIGEMIADLSPKYKLTFFKNELQIYKFNIK